MSCLRRVGKTVVALALAASWGCTIDFDAIQALDASGMGEVPYTINTVCVT